MKKGNILVDQVTKDGVLVEGFDQSLSPQEIFQSISKYYPNIHKASADPRVLLGTYKGYKYAIRCKNITYLGNPHPHYKKRIQISDDLYDFYRLSLSLNAEPFLMGIYSYDDNTIFVDFKIDTYIEKKAHNSSAHVYVSDLAAATEDGYFQKTDYFGNTVTAIRPDAIEVFLDDHFGINNEPADVSIELDKLEKTHGTNDYELTKRTSDKLSSHWEKRKANIKEKSISRTKSYGKIFRDTIVPKIKDFFDGENRNWNGIDCYQKMITANYRNKYQPEWAGFFLEYEFENYLNNNNLNSLITYAQDKKNGGIDLDLYFPMIDSYGDLKAHSEESRGIQGNDWNTVWNIITGQNENSHIYYIVCEHSTEKDSLHDYEVTKYWNTAQGKSNLMSYHKRMKNSVSLKRVYILDINNSNKEYLSQFKQGINSNGKPREPKIMIDQDNLKYFIVEQIVL